MSMNDPEINLNMPPVQPLMPAEEEINLGASAPPQQFPTTTTNTLDRDGVNTLMQQGFPAGLAYELGQSKVRYPIRFWVVDNSGSMRSNDGNRITGSRDKIQVVPCSRWLELQGSVEYHAELAGLLEAPTFFRLLNDPGRHIGPQEFGIANGGDIRTEVEEAKRIIQKSEPTGVTPLKEHVNEIYERVLSMEQSLRDQGQKVAVVLATDGLPSDPRGQSSDSVRHFFVDALRKLQTLPVWIVVRLCTDDESVVEYYSELDKKLELPLEVLDDFFGEGKETQTANPWLNYGLPLHRCREMGYHHRVFDMLDERLLSKDELVEFLQLMFGPDNFQGAPNVHSDWKGFSKFLSKVVNKQGRQWNPVSRKLELWIDMRKLEKAYGNRRGFRLFGRK